MKALLLLVMIGCAVILTSCATQPHMTTYDPPGFIMGFVHGCLSLLSLIGSFFWDIRVYAYPNSGRWYDVGFVLGVACFFGSLGSQSFDKSYVLGYSAGIEAANSKRKDHD
jgi:hypothetical protein